MRQVACVQLHPLEDATFLPTFFQLNVESMLTLLCSLFMSSGEIKFNNQPKWCFEPPRQERGGGVKDGARTTLINTVDHAYGRRSIQSRGSRCLRYKTVARDVPNPMAHRRKDVSTSAMLHGIGARHTDMGRRSAAHLPAALPTCSQLFYLGTEPTSASSVCRRPPDQARARRKSQRVQYHLQ